MPDLSGRDLDAAVAKAIGGNPVKSPVTGLWRDSKLDDFVPGYSGSADAALAAYGVIRERGWMLAHCEDDDEGWVARMETAQVEVQGIGATFPEALCRAIVAAGEKG